MKRLAIFLLVCCLTVLPVLAAGADGHSLLYDGAELEAICRQLDWTLSEEQKQAYKVYTLRRQDVLRALDSGLTLEDLLSEEYVWVVPGYGGSKTILKQKDGVWNFSETVGPSLGNAGVADDTLNYTLVESALEAMPGARVRCFYTQVYRCYFVWLQHESGDGLIPFAARPDFTNLENGRLYSVEEVRRTLGESDGFAEPVYRHPEHAAGVRILLAVLLLWTAGLWQTERKRSAQNGKCRYS